MNNLASRLEALRINLSKALEKAIVSPIESRLELIDLLSQMPEMIRELEKTGK